MDFANKEQAEYWGNSASGTSWLTYEDQLDHLMQPVLDLVLNRSGLTPGMRVLDIGCGTGASTIAAAHHVSPDGHALGIDISNGFLERARNRAQAKGLKNLSFEVTDAQVEPFPANDRDAAISRFGVMFFEDTVAAFANIAKALKPQAKMTFAAWAPLADNLWFKTPFVAAARRLGNPPKVDPNAPGPLAFQDLDRIANMLSDAGLVQIHAEKVCLSLTPKGTVQDAATLCVRVGPAARVISHFEGTEADAAAIQAEVAREFDQFITEQGVRIPATINLFQASRPD